MVGLSSHVLVIFECLPDGARERMSHLRIEAKLMALVT